MKDAAQDGAAGPGGMGLLCWGFARALVLLQLRHRDGRLLSV